MAEVSEAIDDGHIRIFRHLLDDVVAEGADHDALHHALEILGDVEDRFALAEVDFGGRQVDRVSAELLNAHIEAHARPERGLLEDEGERLALE
jgi:hypothetical protein